MSPGSSWNAVSALSLNSEDNVRHFLPFAGGRAVGVERHDAGGLAIGIVSARQRKFGLLGREFGNDFIDLRRGGIGGATGESRARK
jgi:hypothetical protein